MKFLMRVSCVFLFAAAAFGAQIQGRVTNAQGAGVAGAKVTVTQPSEEGKWEATTSADGTYTVTGLASGLYLVAVAGPAGTLRREVVLAAASAEARADFQFAPPAAAAPTAEERNPNIFIYRIDLNDLRNRLTVARGPSPEYISEFKTEQNYFGAEFGAPLFVFEPLRPRTLFQSWRGSLFGLHQNSVLNARNFFNVGPLLPSRSTSYNLSANGPLVSDKASLLLQFGQNFTSGFVNGNVIVPLPEQREALSGNPQLDAAIRSLISAYPAQLPNLANGQLNSNAPRDIDATDALARFDWKPGGRSALAFRYTVSDYLEDPFQLVAGQNPQTSLRNQGAHLNLTRTYSPRTVAQMGFYYDRSAALLETTKRFNDLLAPLGITTVPDLDMRNEATNIGPNPKFPRRRMQNRFQFSADLNHTFGKHTLKTGWTLARIQVNDLQSDNSRGTLIFQSTSDSRGNLSAIDNLQRGTPSFYNITIGDLYRGFRNWEQALYVEDQIRFRPTFSFSLGLRYELMTAPVEVNGRTDLGFRTDKNNFAPRVGFAWNPGGGKTTLRGAYGISYSTIYPISYGMARFNPPAVQLLSLTNRSMLEELTLGNNARTLVPQPGGQSALWKLSPDLEFPYSHQYTFSLERPLPWATTVRASYIGMRSFHLLSQGIYNRGLPSTTIPNTTTTINQRRPDQRYYDINIIESNSNAYYDAAQLVLDKRLSRGLSFRASYAFGKNIDLGGDFTNTSTGTEVPPETGTSACEFCSRNDDQKGVSLFDTPHVFVLSYSYNLPFPANPNGWAAVLFKGWQISGATIFQSGTPFHFHTGSDGPFRGNVDGHTQDRPNVVDPSILGRSLDDPDTSVSLVGADTCDRRGGVPIRCRYFDTDMPVGGRGNEGWNTFRKDGTNNWNVSVGRTFRLPGGRERSVQFRSEFINLMNHAQFEKPGIAISGPTFGQITNTVNKGRQVQFSLRINF